MPDPMKMYIPIAGTWARKKEREDRERRERFGAPWYRADSLFDRTLGRLGYHRVDQLSGGPDPGYWSGDLEGTLLQQFFSFANYRDDWLDGGQKLEVFIRNRNFLDREDVILTLIAHSHGGQVVAFALQRLLKNAPLNLHVVTVDMPVRRGLRSVYDDALTSVEGNWTHLYSTWARMRILGSRFGPRKLEDAARNLSIPGGHSGILNRIDLLYLWGYILP